MEKGKVFADSSGIVEDKARVLFEYFNRAAEKIVSTEMDLERRIGETKAAIGVAEAEKKKAILKNSLIGGAIFLVAAVVGIFVHFLFVLALALLIPGIMLWTKLRRLGNTLEVLAQKKATFDSEHVGIRRSYKIHKLGVAYVPVATLVPFEGKSLLLDGTGRAAAREFSIPEVKDNEEFGHIAEELEALLRSVPLAEESKDTDQMDVSSGSESFSRLTLFDWTGALDRLLRRLQYLFTDLRETTVTLPVIPPGDGASSFLLEFGADGAPDEQKVQLYRTESSQAATSSLQPLVALSQNATERYGTSFEAACRSLVENLTMSYHAVSRAHQKSLEALVDQGNRMLFPALKSAFVQYSPQLEVEEISRIRDERFSFDEGVEGYQNLALRKSSSVRYDLLSDNWVADDGSRTSFPLGIHQILDEIFMPMVTSLMEENRAERLKLYHAIREKKIEYLNQWHRDTEDFYARNRAEVHELGNRMRTVLSEIMSEVNTYRTLERTAGSLGADSDVAASESADREMVAQFETQSRKYQEFLDEFSGLMDTVKGEINELAEQFEHIEYYEASLRDGDARDVSRAMGATNLDERRRPLIPVSHFFAKTCDLPPMPQMSAAVVEAASMDLPKAGRELSAHLARQPNSSGNSE